MPQQGIRDAFRSVVDNAPTIPLLNVVSIPAFVHSLVCAGKTSADGLAVRRQSGPRVGSLGFQVVANQIAWYCFIFVLEGKTWEPSPVESGYLEVGQGADKFGWTLARICRANSPTT